MHADGTFGKRGCPLKSLLSLCIVAWETRNSDMQEKVPETGSLNRSKEYADWLVHDDDWGGVPEIAIVGPWVYERLVLG